VRPGTARNLAAVRRAFTDRLGDLCIVEIEDIAEQKHRPLHRIQPLEAGEERQAQLLCLGDHICWFKLSDKRRRQPRPDVLDAAASGHRTAAPARRSP
jgi:hypothetical protein